MALSCSTQPHGPIIGAEHGLGSVDAAAIMKVWPERGPIEQMTPDAFNAEIGALADSHCT